MDFKQTPSTHRRGPKKNPYKTWLCFYSVCVVSDDTTEFLSHSKQQSGKIGGFAKVGKELNLSPEAVASHVTKALKERDTEEGLRKYHAWLNHRERAWWLYHATSVEKISLKLLAYRGETEGDATILIEPDTLHLTSAEVACFISEASLRLSSPGGTYDYRQWLGLYERRDEKQRVKPLLYLPSSSIDSDFLERRKRNGLRNELSKAGRRRGQRNK
jgi:hypothetical protein